MIEDGSPKTEERILKIEDFDRRWEPEKAPAGDGELAPTMENVDRPSPSEDESWDGDEEDEGVNIIAVFPETDTGTFFGLSERAQTGFFVI